MRRFFIDPGRIFPEEHKALLEGTDVHHISKVLRLKPGDGLILLDGLGNEYQARIVSITAGQVETSLEKRIVSVGEPPLEVNLLQGLPKADKMDLIIQKCTELGVKSIHPLETARTVVKLGEDKKGKKLERWQRIAHEAAKQCRRAGVPGISPTTTLDQALKGLPSETLLLMPWEDEQQMGIKAALDREPPARVALIIGPEGGWAPEEVALARELGAMTVSLGPRVLRCETAGMAALTMLLYQWGDLGG